MKLSGLNILLVSPEAWEHILVSKHHYADQLGRQGNRVFFLGPPSQRESVELTQSENVFAVFYRGFPRGLRFYPVFLQARVIRKKFDKLQDMCNIKFDVIWSFDNSVFYDFSALPKSVIKITHIVDFTQNFRLATAARTADLCLGTSALIVSRLKQYNPRSYFIQHGYATATSEERLTLPSKYFSVKVGYAGNLNLKYIDWKLFETLVASAPQVGFYLAGPHDDTNEIITRMRARPNVFLLGEVPSSMLQTFYRQMDILLICYLADEFADQLANPHKMVQYLGSGAMIVATYTAEYSALEDRGLMLMATRRDDFKHKFLTALNEVGFWNHPRKKRLRMEIAMDNTYAKQLERIEDLLAREAHKDA